MLSGIIVYTDKHPNIDAAITHGEHNYLNKWHREATAIAIPKKLMDIKEVSRLENMGWTVSKHPSPPGCIFVGEET
jgi:hypothetical protein